MRLTETQVNTALQAAVDRLLPQSDEPVRVLDAGCGSAVHVRLPQSAHLTGIDISQRQLDRNTRLHEKILGDLQTHDLPPETFDAVVCWDVLEHLEHPDAALEHLFVSLKPNGILILACPDPRSIKGLLTRFTPHSFHVWSYRHLRRSKRAGTQDYGPFPTVMSPRITPQAVRTLAEARGLVVEFQAAFSGSRFSRNRAIPVQATELAVEILALVLRVVTLGQYRGEMSESRLVLRKAG
jgi:SAM-dependent methyltransferase